MPMNHDIITYILWTLLTNAFLTPPSPDLPFSLPRLTILTSRLTVFKPTAYRSHSRLTVLKVLPIFRSHSSDLPFSTPILPIFVLSPPTYRSHSPIYRSYSPDLQLSLPDLQLSLPRLTVLTPPTYRSHSPDFPFSLLNGPGLSSIQNDCKLDFILAW